MLHPIKRNKVFAEAIKRHIATNGIGIEAKSPRMANIVKFLNTIINLRYEWPSMELSSQELKLLKPMVVSLRADYEDEGKTLQHMKRKHIKKEKQKVIKEKIDYLDEIIEDMQQSTE